jgi:hypothetical protein
MHSFISRFKGDLENRRREFWTTRTGGNQLMWSTIRCACEAVLADDILLANAILEVIIIRLIL